MAYVGTSSASTGWLKRQCWVLAPKPWMSSTANGAVFSLINDQPSAWPFQFQRSCACVTLYSQGVENLGRVGPQWLLVCPSSQALKASIKTPVQNISSFVLFVALNPTMDLKAVTIKATTITLMSFCLSPSSDSFSADCAERQTPLAGVDQCLRSLIRKCHNRKLSKAVPIR